MESSHEECARRLREVILRLKVLRGLDRPVLRMVLEGDEFEERIIKPLVELSEWSDDDERVYREKLTEIQAELVGTSSVVEKGHTISKALKYSGGIAAGITLLTLGAAVARALTKKPKA